jgi:hypothetical protein
MTTTFVPFMRASVSHLRRDPVHAPGHDHFRVLGERQIEVHRLLPRRHRVAGRQVGVPRVVVPAAAPERGVGADLAHVVVEERERVCEAVLPEDAGQAEERHPAAHLDRADAGALRGVDHQRIELLREEPLLARVSAVRRSGRVHRLRDELERFLPTDANERIFAAGEVLCVDGAGLRVARKARARPCEPTLANERILAAAIAVETAHEREPFLATAWIPAVRRAPTGQIFRGAVAEGRPDAHDDAASHVGLKDAVVRVVRRAREHEGAVLGELVAVDPLPGSIRHLRERVRDRDGLRGALRGGGGEELRREKELGHCGP